MQVLSNAIQAIIVILTAMIGAFVLLNTWIKGRGINKKQMEELQNSVKEIKADVHELKGDDRRKDLKIEKIEERLNGIIDFLIGKK